MTMNPWMTHERKIMSLKGKKLEITYDSKSSHNFIVKWNKIGSLVEYYQVRKQMSS